MPAADAATLLLLATHTIDLLSTIYRTPAGIYDGDDGFDAVDGSGRFVIFGESYALYLENPNFAIN